MANKAARRGKVPEQLGETCQLDTLFFSEPDNNGDCYCLGMVTANGTPCLSFSGTIKVLKSKPNSRVH